MAENRIKKELIIEAKVENINLVTQFVDELLEKYDCPMKAHFQIDIAIDELFGNISHYAYSPKTGMATVRMEITDQPKAAVITFMDQGIPYNPLEAKEPDVTLSVQARQVGGLGIYMVRKSMDDMSYEYRNGTNILKITKYF